MAIFFPQIDIINRFKVPPTKGELALIDFLGKVLDDSFEVYFNPFLNGDRPDVIIMRKNHGVMVIEVKDWNLDNFIIDEHKRWIYTPNNSIIKKSPISQVYKYKENLFDLHVDKLLLAKIKDLRHFNIVSCCVYFHEASQSQVNDLIVKPFENDRKYQDFLKYNIDLIGEDSLNIDFFYNILKSRYIISERPSVFFKDEIYNNFKRILNPPIHLKEQGEPYMYSPKQKEIIYSTKLEQRIKGVFGSGKTTVLAARAVQAYKRALLRNSNPKILILTYNITLKNFIHDKLNRVDEDFPFGNFIIINYHQFINAELNNLGIPIVIPDNIDDIPKYIEDNYYSNFQLFEKHKYDIVKYDAVLIDEIQDYRREWMDIVKLLFRDSDGDYVLFGDVKQNIYSQPTENKDVSTNIIGKPVELNHCFRSDFKVQDLAQSFQINVFQNRYDVDVFDSNNTGKQEISFEKMGHINYIYLQNTNTIQILYNIIRGNILNKVSGIPPNDITVLGYTTKLLRTFDTYYRYLSREKTNSMLETIEAIYMYHLNYIGNNPENDNFCWFSNISEHFKRKFFPQKEQLSKNDLIKLRQHIAVLFTIYDLYVTYGDLFEERLVEACNKCGITLTAFLSYRNHYSNILTSFKNNVYNDNYKFIRDNKKLHFWMNSGTIKISTINSFKGWESEVVFMILEKKYDYINDFNIAFDELLYTAITRCKSNLILINFGNYEYHRLMEPLFLHLKD